MSEQNPKPEILYLIREVGLSPNATQRSLASKLNISLGKTNYLLKKLIKMGLLSINNFSKKDKKIKKIKYILTKKGLEERISLTQHYLKLKEVEYYKIKNEWEQLNAISSNKEVDYVKR